MEVEQRFELLKLEMELLQGRFDKYDDLIFRNRNVLIIVLAALVGAAAELASNKLFSIAICLPFVFWVLEMIWRVSYYHKYVLRYRAVREALQDDRWLKLRSYDLTNLYGESPGMLLRIVDCVKVEAIAFYLLLSGISVWLALVW